MTDEWRVIVDLGIPAEVLGFLPNLKADSLSQPLLESWEQALRAIKNNGAVAAIPVLSEAGADVALPGLEPKETVAILTPLVNPPDCSQVDSEGDLVRELCPTRGYECLNSMLKKLAEVYAGVVVDLTDFYEFSSEHGYFSCVCEKCMKEYEGELREVIKDSERELKEASSGALSPEDVLEKVQAGALKILVKSKSEDGYIPHQVMPTHNLSRLLKIVEASAPDASREQVACAYLFVKARDRVCAKFVGKALKEAGGSYSAVAVESDIHSIVGCSARGFIEQGLEVWVGRLVSEYQGATIRFYNLPRCRYLVNSFNFLIWHYLELLKLQTPLIEVSRQKLMNAWQQLSAAVSTYWRPASKPPSGMRYALLGWPPEALTFMRLTVEHLVYRYDTLLQALEAQDLLDREGDLLMGAP
ncbi:hypothetical protein [Infirmifilum sp.]|uniref:hypothetical protein n=1 Tax=Infirmifilum sp. TaxID=2856575 RepID=UPI003D0E73BF